MSSITLHPKYGVNPSLDMCFWCGEARGVVLMGRNKGEEAPRSIITSYEPCDKCKANMALGITAIETMPSSETRPALANDRAPTGRWCVLSEEAVKRVFTADVVPSILKARRFMVPMPDYEAMGLAQGGEE